MFPPVIAGERVYLAHLPGLVAAYGVSDGGQLWREDLNPVIPPVVDGERLFVASKDQLIAVSAADGTPLWRTDVDTISAPLLAKDGWLIAASRTTLRALRASDGSVVWNREAAPQRQAPAIAGDVLFVPASDGWMRAHDLVSGQVLWERQLGGAPAEPLVYGDSVYFGASDKRFYCLNAGNGDIRWDHQVGATLATRPATDGRRVVFVGFDNLVRAVDRGQGAQRWLTGVPFRPLMGPVVVGDLVFVAGTTESVHILRAADGKSAGTVTFKDRLVVAPAIAASAGGPLIAGVTGSLEHSWTLSLASPAPKTDPKADAKKVSPPRLGM